MSKIAIKQINSTAAAGGVLATGIGVLTATPPGLAGQVLTSNGAALPTWQTAAAGGVSVTNLNTTGTYYPVFSDVNTGIAILGVDATTTPITYNPGTGELTATTFAGGWNGTAITLAKGGTNSALSVSAGSIVYGTSTGMAFTTVGTVGQVLVSGGTGFPTWAAMNDNDPVTDDLATATATYPVFSLASTGIFSAKVSSTKLSFIPSTGELTATTFAGGWNGTVISMAKGGAGAALTAAAGGIVYSDASTLAITAAGTAGQVLTSAGAGIPVWASPASSNVTDDTTTATAGYPMFSLAATGAATNTITSTKLTFVPSTGLLTTTAYAGLWSGTIIDLAHGGTNSNITADHGGIAYSTATGLALTPAGIAGYMLQSTGAGTPIWVAPAAASSVSVTPVDSAGSYYPVFTSATSGTATLSVDPTTTAITYNPSTSTLSTSVYSGGSVVTTGAVTVGTTLSVGTNVIAGTWQATNVALGYGGTNAALTAVNGGVVYSDAAAMAITAAGTVGQVLSSNGAAAPTWLTLPSTTTWTDSNASALVHYVGMSRVTSGLGGAYVDSTAVNPLKYVPSTGTLTTNVMNTVGNANIGADLVITGNLTVNGTTVTINAATLNVTDKNISAGNVATPTDTTANGGGYLLRGATDKTILWDLTNTNWTSSEHWNLATGKEFKINTASVLSATTLGSSVVSSSLTSVGTITAGTWTGTNIALANGGTGASLTAAAGGAVYSTATGLAITAAGTAGQVLISNGALAPVWSSGVSTLSVIGSSAAGSKNVMLSNATASGASQVYIGTGTYSLNYDPSIGNLSSNMYSGTWTGNVVSLTFGGTGANLGAAVPGAVPYIGSAGTMAVTAAGTAGQVLKSNGSAAPTWGAATLPVPVVDNTTAGTFYPMFASSSTLAITPTVSSTKLGFNPSTGALSSTLFIGAWAGTTIALNRGGSNANLTAVNGGIVYSTATAMAITPAGTAGQYLSSTGAGAPAWVSPGASSVGITDTNTAGVNYITFTTAASGTVTGLSVDAVTGALTYDPSTGVLAAASYTGTWNGNAITLAKGGSNAALTAVNGGIVYSTASAMAITAVGTAGQYLSSTGAGAPAWVSPAAASIGITDTNTAGTNYIAFTTASSGTVTGLSVDAVTGALTYNPSTGVLAATSYTGIWDGNAVTLAKGGSNASLTAANGGMVYSTASAMAITAAGTAGQLLQSNGAAAPTWVSVASNVDLAALIARIVALEAKVLAHGLV